MEPYVNIMISTIDDRINHVKDVLLPMREDISYIISHQYTDEKYKSIPEDLIRNDIKISQIPGYGLARSRNNAIQLSHAPIGLIADDDVTYTNYYLDKVINCFKINTDVDVATFKIKTPKGLPEYKKYSPKPFKVSKSSSSMISSIEIAFKTKKIKEKKILFDERFGAGQPLLIASEENIFIADCVKKNLNVWFFPEYIVEHPLESSIQLLPMFDKKRVAVMGASDARINGLMAVPKAFYHTLRFYSLLKKNGKKPLEFLKERLAASMYIYRTNKSRSI